MCFELSKIWQNMDIHDHWPPALKRTVAAANHNECSMQSLDYEKATNCLQQIGHFLQTVHVRPSQNLVKLYQFFVLFEWHFKNQVLFSKSNALSVCANEELYGIVDIVEA